MAGHPIFSHATPESIVAWRNGQAITLQECLNDARQVAESLAPSRHMLNQCTDRYHFMIGFVAGLLQNKICILQPSCTLETTRQLLEHAPDLFCLTDTDRADKKPDLLCVDFPSLDKNIHPGNAVQIPQVESSRHVATVFTSGSTGKPVPHHKKWGSLVCNIRAEAQRLGLKNHTVIVGTVPPQHMYGFESTVLLAMQGGFALCAEQPFYPADIHAVIERLPCPRILVSTPFHLRTLTISGVSLPKLERVISATAPLSTELAHTIESQSGAPLVEIYGCTETGQLASRSPTISTQWTMFPGVTLLQRDDAVYAAGGHLESATALDDHYEFLDESHFLLLGRSSDTLNIAGKRTSLAYLNQQLNAIPGVEDGAFLVPGTEQADSITRPTALVVAPKLDKATLLNLLRERIDPVFLPRPLLLVESLPRNETGKLPALTLDALLQHSLKSECSNVPTPRPSEIIEPETIETRLEIPANHPAYAGHFPGYPVFPGALLLDHLITVMESTLAPPCRITQISAAKFLSPLRPGESVILRHQLKNALISFSVSVDDRIIAKGQAVMAPDTGDWQRQLDETVRSNPYGL
jgi:acyl-CoA synthetase (AMP-forming)/AMP-acid ligase II/3-hydroxymyristoyl/3-hydroxydecanoyl-(acyl carrier protein) dehydratase